MEHKIKSSFWILFFGFWIFSGCGSGGANPPAPVASVSAPVSKTVLFSPSWPEDLKSIQSQLQVNASLKGSDLQGKAAGVLGPVIGQSTGSSYQFVFSQVPGGLAASAEVSVEVRKESSGLSADCSLVAKVAKTLTFKNNQANFEASSDSFDRSMDCDGDGLANLKEFEMGLNPAAKDTDGDGTDDAKDIFPLDPKEWADSDGDGIGDNEDNCPTIANADQKDFEGDKVGDICDPDIDNDGISNDLEAKLKTDPFKIDTDGDGFPDNLDAFPLDSTQFSDRDVDGIADPLDNCADAANADQSDFDHDDFGDVCDDDIDGDGLSNAEELSKGRDAVITDLKNPDSDADGLRDGFDNCPLTANLVQEDNDGDSFGDVCDCKPLIASIYPGAVDDPDSGYVDSNCDGMDGDKEKAIFVSAQPGNDDDLGTPSSPLKNLTTAIARAKVQGKDVYVGAGTYSLKDVAFLGGVRIFGGYKTGGLVNHFSERNIVIDDPAFATVFVNNDSDTTLSLENLSSELLLDGIHFVQTQLERDPTVGSRTIVINNSKVLLTNNKILGSTQGTRTTAVAVLGSASAVMLEGNNIDGGSGDDASTGVLIDTADNVTLRNNMINGGAGRFPLGIDVMGASPNIMNNTVDGTSHFRAAGIATSEAIRFQNALGLKLSKNIFITGVADNQDNQYVMLCNGLEPTDPSLITGNLLAPFPSTDTTARIVGCLGDFDFAAADGLTLGAGTPAVGNLDYSGSVGDLLSGANYPDLGAPR